jgi:hypothetical protein
MLCGRRRPFEGTRRSLSLPAATGGKGCCPALRVPKLGACRPVGSVHQLSHHVGNLPVPDVIDNQAKSSFDLADFDLADR